MDWQQSIGVHRRPSLVTAVVTRLVTQVHLTRDFRPIMDRGYRLQTACVFLTFERTLNVPCHAAQARLVNLVSGGGLHRASRTAYQSGLKALMRVGPLGDLPGTSKLVEVSFVDPVERDGATTTGLRWEATGATAGLFPVLDANITLAPEGDRTLLSFAGTYRPPLGRLGAGLDKTIMRRVAAATIRALLADVASALSTPAPTADDIRTAPRPDPVTGSAEP